MCLFLAILICICALIGCRESDLTSSGSQNTLSSATYYLSSDTKVRVFEVASTDVSGLGTFVTELTSNSGVLQIPSTLTKGDYGTRTDPSVAQTMDLNVKAYNSSHPSGDFLFEAPLLGPDVAITNVTTAVTWLLRWGYNSPSLKISQNSFSSIVTSVELICSNCRAKTNSQVLSFIQSRSDLLGQIQTILNVENPGLNLTYSWNPSLYYAYSSPVLSTPGYGAQSSKQLETVTTSVLLIHPEQSTTAIRPTSWLLTRADNSTETLGGGDLTYTFTNEDQVSVDFKPTFDSTTLGNNITIHYEVARANRAPVCAEPITLSLKANRMNSIDLTAYCYDPNNATSTPNLGVNYALISGPSGLTISTSGVLKWSPANSMAGTRYSFQVLVTSATSVTHTAQGYLDVTSVQIPTFANTLSGINFTEGSSSTTAIEVNDPEGDPLVLVVSPVTSVKTGSPAGGGLLTSYTTGGTTTAPEFNWNFMPSYLQTIGGNGSMTLRFSLKYNTAVDSTLDSSQTLASMDATFGVINTDDPPVWDVNPQSYDLVEGQTFNIPVGHAYDPNPNSTAVTYSFQSADGQCDWSDTASLTVDGSGNVFLTGYPSYVSKDTCSFQIIAQDQSSLKTTSQTVTYNVANTNRPVTELTGVTEVDGFENKSLILPLSDMFTDPDVDAGDTRESLTWTCMANTDGSTNYSSDCLSLGINFTLSTSNFSGSWYPPYGSAGTYYINLTVTDSGNTSASHAFKLVIAASPAPMVLSLAQGGSSVSTLTASEGVPTQVTLQVRAQSAAAVNQYTYNVSAPTCYVSSTSGSGSCSASMIQSPSSLEGNGDQDFVFTLNPSYTDGNAVLPASSKSYIITFTVTNADDSTVQSQVSVLLTVNNTNRSPTAISLSSGSQGCTGSSANSLTTAFTICIDLSKNSKSGTTWTKTYSMTLGSVDPDGDNDSYSYSLPTNGPGTISGVTWTIRLPTCLYSGTTTVSRTYNLELSDGRGGTVTRTINLTIQKGFAATTCL